MKLSSAGFCLLIALLTLGGIRTGIGAEPGPVTLGAIYNLSGSQASLDGPSLKGARLAIEEANKKGGVLGRKVRLVVEDGESSPKTVTAKTQALLQRVPTIAALMGLSDTDMVLAAAPVAAKAGRLFLTSGATSPKLPGQVPDYLYLACFGDNVQAAAAAEYAFLKRSARTVSVLYDDTMSYTRLLQAYFRIRFMELGGEVLSLRSFHHDTIEQATEGLEKPDVIFVAAGPDNAGQVVRLLRKSGHSVPILGGDGFDSEDLWRTYPEARGVFFTTHAYLGGDNPNPAVRAFRESYAKAYPDSAPDAFSALGYDTARLLLTAIEKAKSDDPAKVAAALSGIGRFDGVTGPMAYSGGSRIPYKSVTILEIKDGKRSLVGQLVPQRIAAP